MTNFRTGVSDRRSVARERRSRDDDEFNDRRLLQRDILRFDADIRFVGALWDLNSADDRDKKMLQNTTLSVNLQRAVTDI